MDYTCVSPITSSKVSRETACALCSGLPCAAEIFTEQQSGLPSGLSEPHGPQGLKQEDGS